MSEDTLITSAPEPAPADTPTPAPSADQAPASEPAKADAPADGEQSKEGDKAADKPAGAPEKYEAFTLPEGTKISDELNGDLAATAKELGLTQEQAQKLADLAAKHGGNQQTAMADAVQKARAEWAQSSTSDKEFGGEKLSENLAVAKKAMDQFGTPELKTLLNESGLGNHPEIIRAFYRAGKAISEDRVVTHGNSSAERSKDPAKVLYPNQA